MGTPSKSGVLVFLLHETLKHSALLEGASFGGSNRPLCGNTQNICSGCPCISMHMTLRERDLALSEWQGVCSKRMCCPWVMDEFHWMRSEGRWREFMYYNDSTYQPISCACTTPQCAVWSSRTLVFSQLTIRLANYNNLFLAK